MDELDDAHHSLRARLYTTAPLLWFDAPSPYGAEREWLRAKYPAWDATYAPLWDES